MEILTLVCVIANESPEELAARLEMERLQAQEEALARENKLRTRMKEQLAREEVNTKMNSLKINENWRIILRKTKLESLKASIEVLSQNHEREVDRKDAIIQMLARDLEEAEEQYQVALRAHLSNIDRLIEIQKQRLREMEFDFEKDVYTVQSEFGKEKEEIMEAHNRQKQELLEIMHRMESEFNESELEAKQEFTSQREEIKNRNSTDYNMLKIQLESQIEDLEKHFENAHANYISNTEHRTQAFKMLTLRDQQNAKTIETQMRKLQRLQESLHHWKTKMSNNVRECELRNKALREEKDNIQRHFQHLKSRMNKFRDGQHRRLAELTTNANTAHESLSKKLSLAERILRLSEICRKLETEQEKVLPFYQDTQAEDGEEAFGSSQERQFEPNPNALQSQCCFPDGTPVNSMNYLDRYYKRYNKVLLEKTAMEKERAALAQENNDLKTILKQYLDGISVNEEVLQQNNPLFVVNNRSNVSLPPVSEELDRPVVVEASVAVRTQRIAY